MKEAMHYERLESSAVRCGLCPHECRIEAGSRGLCGVRENRGGTLYALNYGMTAASAIGPIEKKPLHAFLPGTWSYSYAAVGCNMRCGWCQNYALSQSPKQNRRIKGRFLEPETHVELARRYGCESLAATYSEPTIYFEYALSIMRLAHEAGLKNIWVSNGFINPAPLEDILPYLDAANIDYKGPSDEMYRRHCGARAAPVMETMRRLQQAGKHLEVTTLIIPGINDSEDSLEAIAATLSSNLKADTPWHLSRFFPAWKSTRPPTPLPTLKRARRIGRKHGMRNIRLGNV